MMLSSPEIILVLAIVIVALVGAIIAIVLVKRASQQATASENYAGVKKYSGLAIASLVFGIPFCIFVFSIPAVICGHLARKRIRTSQGSLTGDGLAIAGLVMGYTGIALGIVMIITNLIGFFMWKSSGV